MLTEKYKKDQICVWHEIWHHHYPEAGLSLSFPRNSGLWRKHSSTMFLLTFFIPACFSPGLTNCSSSAELTIIEWLIGRFHPPETVWLLLSLCSFNWKRTDAFRDALLSQDPLCYPPSPLTLQKYKAKIPLCLFLDWDDCLVAFRLHKGLGFQSSTNSVKPGHRSSPSGEDWDGNGSKAGLKRDPLYLKSSVKPWQWNKRQARVYPNLEERLCLQQLDLDWILLWACAKTCFCFHLLFHLLPTWKKFHTAIGINRNDPKGRR